MPHSYTKRNVKGVLRIQMATYELGHQKHAQDTSKTWRTAIRSDVALDQKQTCHFCPM